MVQANVRTATSEDRRASAHVNGHVRQACQELSSRFFISSIQNDTYRAYTPHTQSGIDMHAWIIPKAWLEPHGMKQ